MQLRRDNAHLELRISAEELTALQNGLNEAIEALDEWEFPIRVGVETSEARRILRDLQDARKQLERETSSDP